MIPPLLTRFLPAALLLAASNVGVLDTVRVEESANGGIKSEFGTVKEPAEFRALLPMSAHHAIQDGTAYLRLLLVHGMNDPRVDVWQTSKAAARRPACRTRARRPTLLRLDAQAGHGMGSTHTQRQAMAADVCDPTP